MDKVGDARVMLAIRGRMGLLVKVSSSTLDQISKPERVLSGGCFATSVRDDTWVTVLMHQVATTVVSLVIWQGIVRTSTITRSLVILFEII